MEEKTAKRPRMPSLLIDQDGKLVLWYVLTGIIRKVSAQKHLWVQYCILVPTANTKTEPMEMFEQKISESGKLLLSIINNVLDMSRIESGKVET